jgi:hypothetical protein
MMYDDEETDYRPRRRSAAGPARPARRYPDDEDPDVDGVDGADGWAADASPARRAEWDEERRDSLMRRRLRAARGEEFDDDLDNPGIARPSRYPRSGLGYAPRSSGGGCATSILYLVLGAIAVLVLLLLVGRQIVGSVTNSVNVPAQIRQIVATPTVTVFDRGGTIKQIRDLNRLETNSFSVERVIEANVQRGNLLDSILGERLLLIASGNVIAGVDMSKLKESDVTISQDGKSITIDLPPSEIFVSALDNQRTRVYDRQTRIGTQLFGGENKDLETQARQEAENEILHAACEGGIMLKAADEAKRSMEQFLRLLKFQEVQVNGTAGSCVAPTQPNAPAPTP